MAFDIETHGPNNEFLLACFYSEEKTFICRSKTEILNLLNSRFIRNYTIYATNLSFDFLGCFMDCPEKWRIIERNGVVYSFKWYQNQNKDKKQIYKNPVNFYDTLRLYPASVEKLGELLNEPKLQQPKCFKKIPQNTEEWDELITYCLKDCKITHDFIMKVYYPYLVKNNLKPCITIGSTALQDFKNNYLKIPLFQESEQARDFAFKSYYGGRTETFKRGTYENVFCFDINSLYPSVMYENDFPNPNRSKILKNGSEYLINKYDGISFIKIEVPYMDFPPLPVRIEGKLIFPYGIIEGYYCHNEIINALKFGCKILEVGESIIYTKKEGFFKEFVAKHYQERLKYQKENNPLEIMEKLILNNLYGKFGFNYKETSTVIPSNQFDFNKHVLKASFLKPILNGEFVSINSKNINPPAYCFPILSAYITAYARIKLYTYLSDNRLKNKILACDTDSIFLKDYSEEIKTSNELGDMKLEKGFPVSSAIFVRPKMYLTNKPKCKGIKFDKKRAKEQFIQILNNETMIQERFIKYRSVIRSKETHKNGLLQINQIIEIPKNLNLEDTKRIWENEFNYLDQENSKPININEYQTDKEKKQFLKYEKDFYKKLLNEKLNEDSLDSKGWDISEDEFIKNEFTRPLN